MSDYSFFLVRSQAAWIASIENLDDEDSAQGRAIERKIFFSASADEKTSRLRATPNIGTEVSLSHREGSKLLGGVSTCFAEIDGHSQPIEQIIELYSDRDFFNDIQSMGDTKLHLHVKCAIPHTDEKDFREESVVWFRFSILPVDPKGKKLFFKNG